MKDAKGHGSDTRGGSKLDVNGKGIIPSRPYREGTAHQMSIAEQHGIGTDHLMNSARVRTFGGDTPGTKTPAGSRLGGLVREFAKSESGEGKVPHGLHHFDLVEKGPEAISSVMKHATQSLHEGSIDLHSLVHFAHFLGFLGAIAVIDLLAMSVGLK
jgi:hypothetical protein